VQMATRAFAGHDYLAAVRGAELPAFDLGAEPESAATAILASPPERVVDVDWRIDAFDDLRLLDHAVVAQSFYDLGAAAIPHGLELDGRQHGASADLAIVRLTDAAGQAPADALGFADPFPDDYAVLVTAVAWYPEQHQVGDDVPTALFDAIWVRRDLADAGAPIAPPLSPPRNLRASATDLSWDPPALGTPDLYEVDVYPLASAGGATTARAATRLEVRDGTSVRIPATLLDPDAAGFVFRVAAVATAPEAWASTQSGVILTP
ncbi:MAG TPA: hypothetical protein VL172_05430, partial [Kofleriaceae bacterium]|nr:hypothetical protein [Kofleriaceae bacterium]